MSRHESRERRDFLDITGLVIGLTVFVLLIVSLFLAASHDAEAQPIDCRPSTISNPPIDPTLYPSLVRGPGVGGFTFNGEG